jgi:hypothetical protein
MLFSNSRKNSRTLVLAVLLLAATVVAGCRDRGASRAADPVDRFSQLLHEGASPGELTKAEREEAERLVLRFLPPLTGPLAGYHWRVAYDDLPKADFFSIDLMHGEGDKAPRAMWFHLFWHGPLPAPELAAWPERVGEWPARGVEGHHLFVRVGGVELRAVAEAAEYRDPQRIRSVVERFDLRSLAKL